MSGLKLLHSNASLKCQNFVDFKTTELLLIFAGFESMQTSDICQYRFEK